MTLELKSIFNNQLNQWVIEVQGEIDVFTAKDFREELIRTYNEKQENIILDFGNLNYLDSTGLGVIIGAYGRMKEQGKEISIKNAKSNILKLMTITGLDKILIKSNC